MLAFYVLWKPSGPFNKVCRMNYTISSIYQMTRTITWRVTFTSNKIQNFNVTMGATTHDIYPIYPIYRILKVTIPKEKYFTVIALSFSYLIVSIIFVIVIGIKVYQLQRDANLCKDIPNSLSIAVRSIPKCENYTFLSLFRHTVAANGGLWNPKLKSTPTVWCY